MANCLHLLQRKDEMTNEQIDREIAEKVMEWTIGVCEDYWWDSTIAPESVIMVDRWHPTTDIKQAFEVVEKLNLAFYIINFCLPSQSGKWKAVFIKIGEFEEYCSGEAETPALAICKAALEAIETSDSAKQGE